MIRKVIYKGVILFLFPGFLYSQWWSSNLNDATAFNNGRHIQIIPDDYPFNHIVYHTYESGLYEGHYVVYDCVYQFTHYNMVINSSENVAYPSIAVAPYDYPNGPFAAIAYLTGSLDSHPEILVPTGTPRVALCFFPDEGPTWQYLDIPIVGVAGVPSIELIGAAITDGEGDTPEWAPIFLVTFARYNVCVTPYTYSVELWEIKVGRHPDGSPDPHAYELLEIDEGTSPVSNPSSAVFPYYSGDAIAGWYFHTVWDGGSIRYAVSTMPSSNPEEDVELIGVVTLETGSQSHPHISRFGDRIWLTWSTDYPTEIVRRFRWANYSGDPNLLTGWYPSRDPDNYEHPDTISTWDFGPDDQHNSETLMSDWSQGDASVVVWVEEDPIDGTRIYLRDYDPIHPERGNFSRNPMDPAGPDATPDSFPNIVCFNTGGGMYGEIRAVATEGFDPSYEVVFDRSPHRPPFEPSMIHQTPDSHPVLSPFVYYEITCGDSSPSYYCIKRDGCSTINGHKVDIGSNELLYRLPLLDPPYYYLIQAVVAAPRFISGNQNLPENVSQTFDFDGKRVSISVNATKPETLYYILPQEIYKNDHYVRLRINGSKGAYLENLKVYQFVRRNQTRRQTYRGISSIKRSDSSLSFSIAPTLFNQVIDIKFQLEREEKVNLAIYDATGKLVKRLVSSSTLEPGIHTLSWNRKDETGKILPTGLYFVRLKTESATLTQKVMLIR